MTLRAPIPGAPSVLDVLDERIDDLEDGDTTHTEINVFKALASTGNALTVSVDNGQTADDRRFVVENNQDIPGCVDVNFRSTVINIGETGATDSEPGTQIIMASPPGDTSGAISIRLPGTGNPALLFNRLGAITSYAYGQASTFYQVYGGSDANPVFRISDGNGGGQMNWGAGGGSGTDTVLYRSAANVLSTDDDFAMMTAGKGLRIKEGSNAKMGTAVLVGGTVTVSTTAVTANSRIFLTCQLLGGTAGALRVTSRTASTSFVVTSSSGTDTSTIAWMMMEPA